MNEGQQEGRPKWGGYRRGRRHRDVELQRLIVDVRVENRKRVEAIAEARGKSLAECVDDMIEADWKRRERKAQQAALIEDAQV